MPETQTKPQIKKLTLKDLEKMIQVFRMNGFVNDDTEIWLSSDEEGNNFSPLIQVDDQYNAGIEEDASRLTLYPTSGFEE